MNDLLNKALTWLFPEKTKAHNGPLTLEGLDFKLRLAISAVCFFYIFTEPCVDNSTLSTAYCFVFAPLWMIYLYLIAKRKNDTLTGLLGLIMIIGMNAMIMYRGGYCLRLIGSSLGILAMFAVQGYSPVLVLTMGASYLALQSYFFYHFENVYEPITQSYRIPAVPLEGAIRGWRVALVIEIVCLIIYQATLRKLWANYQKSQRDLENANQKLQDTNDRLSKTVEELALLNKQLQQALNSQDLFVACVSHELRNPLNVILGGLDLLESQTKGDNCQVHQIIKTSKVCGDSLLSQINNLLDVAKINAEKLEINAISTKMSVLLDKFWTITRIGLEKKDLSGCLIVDRKLPMWLEIDSLRLEQILNNLVGNAIKFTSQGSVRVTFTWQKEIEQKTLITDKESQPDLKVQKRDSEPNDEFPISRERLGKLLSIFTVEHHNMQSLRDFISFKPGQSVIQTLDETLIVPVGTEGYVLKIDVIDTGIGIPKEKQEKIFEPFIQADQSITRKHGGTGLGLYIAKNLVDKMNGTMKVTSMDNIGTHFQIILPVKATEQPRRVQKARKILPISPSVSARKTRTALLNIQAQEDAFGLCKKGIVLIVDDDPFNQNLMKTYFKKLGFESDIANNGLEGLQLYQANPKKYTFITMDIQMPVMDGITACRMIRKCEKDMGKGQRIPIMVVTGNCSESEQKECLEDPKIGASFFFRKPFRLSDCEFCVHRITKPHTLSVVDAGPNDI